MKVTDTSDLNQSRSIGEPLAVIQPTPNRTSFSRPASQADSGPSMTPPT
jgi:hypothetical protein